MSLPPVVAPVQNDALIDLEPDEAWKDDLRDRINQAFASMVQEVDTAYQRQIQGKSDQELSVLKLEHVQTMTNVRNFKEESFTIELERERQERRWVSGARMLPEWSNALVKEQHQIMKSITGQIEMTKKSSQSNDSNEGPPPRPKTPTNVAKWNEVTQERKDRSMQGLERMIRDGRWRTNPSNSSGTPDHQVGNGSSKVTEIVDPEEEQRRTRQQEVFRHREQQILERKRQNKLKTFLSGFKSADSSKSSASSGASTVILASPTKEDTSVVPSLPLLASSPSFPDSFDDAISNMAQEPQPLSELLEGQSIDGYPGSGTDPFNVNVYAFTVPQDNPNGVDASQSKQELLKRMEEDISQREVAVGQREEELAKLEESMLQREEQLRKREDEAIHREDKRKKELESKEQELTNLENELHAREKATRRKLEALTSRARNSILCSILADTVYHRRLLKCVGSDAQTLLDAFQTLLDAGVSTREDRTKMIVAMQRLSARTELYPLRYVLDGPVHLLADHAVNAGRFADIYKAKFRGESTCLKVVRAFGTHLVQHMAKIYAREAILWGQLSHPNVLPFYGLHFFRSHIAFVAPWAEKGNLSDYLALEPFADRLLLCADTSAGVEYLHANGVVHGDLKPLNILVDGSGRACLGDFGLSGVVDKDIVQWTTQSSAASKGGTTRWQAPELHDPENSNVHNTKESDIYAWASTCYEIFTGNAPFYEVQRETTVALMILKGSLPTRPPAEDISWTTRGLSTGIWELLEECWKTEPSGRPGITSVITRLKSELPDVDIRPPGQWETGFAMKFRNAQERTTGTSAREHDQEKRTNLEDLDTLLLKIIDSEEACHGILGNGTEN